MQYKFKYGRRWVWLKAKIHCFNEINLLLKRAHKGIKNWFINSEVYSEPSPSSKVESFAKKNGLQSKMAYSR